MLTFCRKSKVFLHGSNCTCKSNIRGRYSKDSNIGIGLNKRIVQTILAKRIRVKGIITLCIREDHFEMNFVVKIYKFAKSLVKIGISNIPKPFLGPTPL